MKKLIGGFLCVLLAVLPLAGCGGEPASPTAEKDLIYALPGVAFGMTMKEACDTLGWKLEEATTDAVQYNQKENTEDSLYTFEGREVWGVPMKRVAFRVEEQDAPLNRGVVELNFLFSEERREDVVKAITEMLDAQAVWEEDGTASVQTPPLEDLLTETEWGELRRELIAVREVFGEIPEDAAMGRTEEEIWDSIMEQSKKRQVVSVLLSADKEEKMVYMNLRGPNAAMLNRMRMEKEQQN